MNNEDVESTPHKNRYFELMQVVGTQGRYQMMIFLLFCIINYLTGFMALGTPFYFYLSPYVGCPIQFESNCNDYVCKLESSQRFQYQSNDILTIANQFGDYHCENQNKLKASYSCFYIGNLVGFIILGILVDNLGRKLTLVISLTIACIGLLILLFSPILIVANIGLFLIGFGIQNSFNISFSIIPQIAENNKRQKYLVLVQIFFPVGGLASVFFFYLIKNWKIIFWVFIFTPCFILLILISFLLQQTPRFLIKRHSIHKIIKSFTFIAKMNKKYSQMKTNQLMTQKHLNQMKDQLQNEYKRQNKVIFTFLDLIRYHSLRKITLLLCLIVFFVDLLYYAPIMLIDQFGFNVYLSGVIVNCSEMITYIYSYLMICKLKRKKCAIILFSTAAVCTIFLLFVYDNHQCTENCLIKEITTFALVFIFRFSISLQFQLLLIYTLELYPTQVFGLGLGLISIISVIPSTFLPQVIAACNQANFPIMIIFTTCSVLAIVASWQLPQTHGKMPKENIEQFDVRSIKNNDERQIQLVEEQN